MIPITINSQKLNIPTRWEDVTFKQYIDYIDLKNPKVIDAVALFTGIETKVWEGSKEIQNFYIIVNALEFLGKKPQIKKAVNPGTVTIRDKEYKVPQNIDSLPYMVKQFEDMRGLIRLEAKQNEITIKMYPRIISIYFCNMIFKKYSVRNIEKTEPLIDSLGMFEVLGMGNFFLQNMTELLNGIARGELIFRMIVRKLKRVFTGSMSGVS